MIDASKFNLTSSALEHEVEALVGPPGQWQARRDLQLTLLDEFGLNEQKRFLDLGCGSLRLGLPLIDFLSAGNYTGVDIDPDCIAAAHKLISQFQLQEKSPSIVQSSTFGLDELSGRGSFDIVWIFQVLIHLTEEFVRRAMTSIAALVADDGAAYGTAFIDDRLEALTLRGKWRHYALAHGPLRFYQDCAAEVGLRLIELDAIDETGRVQPKQPAHPCTATNDAH